MSASWTSPATPPAPPPRPPRRRHAPRAAATPPAPPPRPPRRRHAPRAAAAVTYLGALSPHRAGDYRWMQDEVLCSRLYTAGHVTSDLTAGTLLGDLIGDYEPAVGGHR